MQSLKYNQNQTKFFLRFILYLIVRKKLERLVFLLNVVEPIEGDNIISAKTSHRGGDSAWSPDYKVTVDTGAPNAPVSLTAKALAGGTLQFTWQAGAGEVPTGYNLYVSSSAFTSLPSSPSPLAGEGQGGGVSRANTSPIAYIFREYIPADDNKKYYAATALDGAGNESGISNVISIASDRTSPTLADIKFYASNPGPLDSSTPASLAGPGTVKVKFTTSEPIKELPFVSLEPQEGSPIVVSMTMIDETHYEGTFTVNTVTPHGSTTYKFSGKDIVGNRGNAQGVGVTIDVKGPDATIQTPLNIQQIKPEPVQIGVVFNEPSVTTPILELKATDGTTIQINDLTTSDNGIHWTGTTDISAMPEGKTEFILKEAKDKLGNIGATVISGRYILLYKDTVPSPGIPADLAAKPGKGGIITLTWTPVTSKDINVNITYNLYRRGENETEAVKIKTGIPGSPVHDTPPFDGTYHYSLTAVGLLNTEGEKTGEIQAASDRTGPGAPINPVLSFDSRGIAAAWTMPSGETPASYNLYRSETPITTTQGLTPTAYTKTTNAVDTSPTKAYRYYAITALDALGNEGPLSESKEITYPVSPVRNLILQRIENAAPVITWEAPADNGIIGYHIYRNGSRITQTPTLSMTYTDGYYSTGMATYGISAVDNINNESPVKEVTIQDIAIGLKQGTTMRRGVLETVPVTISNNAPNPLTIDAIEVQVGGSQKSVLQGPFNIGANTGFQVEKVASTTGDAPQTISILIGATWSPSPGVTVKIYNTSLAEVTGSSNAFELFSDPLIRGTNTKVRLKANNIGSAQMEFLTSENSTETKKVKINLRDQDGNVLSTAYLDQRTGNAIVNTGAYAVARLNQNETVTTEPIMLPVPQSAPSRVTIEANIDNTYYHYNKPDQVTGPGMSRSLETTISDTPYRATAAPEKTFYPTAQPVLITGQAIDNITNNPVPNVPVKLGISVKGFDRYYTATTDSNGSFTYTFTPGANESGNYSIWAVHPDITTRTVQSTFTIAGLSINPTSAIVKMMRNRTTDIPVNINNYGEAPLTGLHFATESSPGITAEVINSGDNTLTAGEQAGITLRLTASSTAPDTGSATLTASVNEGLQRKLEASIVLVSAIPVISTIPSYIDTGMVRGTQKVQTFNITNTGMETLKNARIEGPSLPWLSLTSNKTIGDIPAGSSANIGIVIKPSETIPQGVYDDRITIYADNHIPYTYNIQVTVTSNAVGNVIFDVLNLFSEDVPNATITLQHQQLLELIYTVKTGPDGTAMAYDIPEGKYTYVLSPPPGHIPASGTFLVNPGITTPVYIALDMKLVDISWSVVPTVIEDRYEIKVTQTFETKVPVPVLVTEPPVINIPEMKPGEVVNGEFNVKNYGLIAAENVKIDYPKSFLDHDIEVFTSVIPNKIGAMQTIAVPFKITRRQTVAGGQWSEAGENLYACNSITDTQSLYDEVQGYGGSQCTTSTGIGVSGNYTKCPNTPQQSTGTSNTSLTLAFQQTCPTPTTTAGTYIPPTNTGSYGSGGGSGQTTGSGQLPPQLSIIPTPGEPCRCKADGTSCGDDGNICTADKCMGEKCEHPPDDSRVPPQKSPTDCTKEKCSGGSIISYLDSTESCNDGKYCTSYTGTEVGPDHCVNGNCVGNQVKDKEDTAPVTTTYDIPGLVNKILEWIEKAGLGNKVELVGKLDLTVQTFKRCCEEKKDVLEGEKKTIGGSVRLKNKELVNQVVRIIPRVGTINAIADIDGSYSLSAEVKGEPCKNEQGNWSGSGSVAGSIAGGYTFEPITDYLYDLTDISGKLESKLSGSITVSGAEGRVTLSFNGVTAVGTLKIKGLGGISIPIKIVEGGDLGSFTFPMP